MLVLLHSLTVWVYKASSAVELTGLKVWCHTHAPKAAIPSATGYHLHQNMPIAQCTSSKVTCLLINIVLRAA
jgi:hypothetical protein